MAARISVSLPCELRLVTADPRGPQAARVLVFQRGRGKETVCPRVLLDLGQVVDDEPTVIAHGPNPSPKVRRELARDLLQKPFGRAPGKISGVHIGAVRQPSVFV